MTDTFPLYLLPFAASGIDSSIISFLLRFTGGVTGGSACLLTLDFVSCKNECFCSCCDTNGFLGGGFDSCEKNGPCFGSRGGDGFFVTFGKNNEATRGGSSTFCGEGGAASEGLGQPLSI
jgi:hypothetical protein